MSCNVTVQQWTLCNDILPCKLSECYTGPWQWSPAGESSPWRPLWHWNAKMGEVQATLGALKHGMSALVAALFPVGKMYLLVSSFSLLASFLWCPWCSHAFHHQSPLPVIGVAMQGSALKTAFDFKSHLGAVREFEIGRSCKMKWTHKQIATEGILHREVVKSVNKLMLETGLTIIQNTYNPFLLTRAIAASEAMGVLTFSLTLLAKIKCSISS